MPSSGQKPQSTPAIDNANRYAETYRQQYDFEQHMVAARQQHVLKQLTTIAPTSLIEVGCGQALLIDKAAETSSFKEYLDRINRWHIVEPADAFYHVAQQASINHPNLVAHHNRFEQLADLPHQVDAVILSSLLHEVEDADALIETALNHLAPHGSLIINVPNGQSLHRQLACAMGLTQQATQLSPRNISLNQPRVFTQATLTALLQSHQLTIRHSGGYMLKPFSHQQMADCLPHLPPTILLGLSALGEDYPELASEISVIATR